MHLKVSLSRRKVILILKCSKKILSVVPSNLVLLSHMVTSDPDAGGASGLFRGDSGRKTGEDAAPHRVLSSFSTAQPRRGGPPSRPIPGRLAHTGVKSCINSHEGQQGLVLL